MKNNIEKYREELVKVLLKTAKDKGLFARFLKDILSPQEFNKISVRWQIVKKLQKGEKHRDIARDLGLGISTVTRGSRGFYNKNSSFIKISEKLSSKRE